MRKLFKILLVASFAAFGSSQVQAHGDYWGCSPGYYSHYGHGWYYEYPYWGEHHHHEGYYTQSHSWWYRHRHSHHHSHGHGCY